MPTLDNFLLVNFGLAGTPVKYASGNVINTSSSRNFNRFFDSALSASYFAEASFSLNFDPAIVIVRANNGLNITGNFYIHCTYLRDFVNSKNYKFSGVAAQGYEVKPAFDSTNLWFDKSSGFRLPIPQSTQSDQLIWEAFG